nr:putative transcription factor gsfr1 [Quercus suber]
MPAAQRSDGNAPATHSRISKQMRKGTKSCRSCRRRKTRCLYPEDGETHRCKECTIRNLVCVPQGLLDDENLTSSHKLTSRLATLESNVDMLISSGAAPEAGQSGPDNREKLLYPTSQSYQQNNVSDRRPIMAKAEFEPEEAMSGSVAPLMTALGKCVLSASCRPLRDGPETTQILTSHVSQPSEKYKNATKALRAVVPSQAELQDICSHHAAWWPLWRDCLDLTPEGPNVKDFHQFATHALEDGHPALLATLLVGLTISTNDHQRYLPHVEQWILNDDQLASTEHGLKCLISLGLYHITTLQPRRAWTIYRRANTLLQLSGLHLTHRKSEKQGSIFWPLYHADRWVSLLIGLPYTLQDHFCDIRIPPISEMSVELWLYRQLAVVTGRVIDCLQSTHGPSLSSALAVEEQLDDLVRQLPPGYLNVEDIRNDNDKHAKFIRLYRAVHFYQLRAYVHLPLLLLSSTEERFGFSRKSCLDDNRRVLEAYLEIFNTDPISTVHGGMVNFVAFIAAVITLLGIMGYGHQDDDRTASFSQRSHDWQTIHRVMNAIKASEKGMSAALCNRCHSALEGLINSAQNIGKYVEKTVVLPYFGAITISGRGGHAIPHPDQTNPGNTACNGFVPAQSPASEILSQPSAPFHQSSELPAHLGFDDVSLVYSGPYLTSDAPGAWPAAGADDVNAMPATWDGMLDSDDWSWLNSDLPPNFIC